MKMISRILLLLILSSCLCATFVVNVTQSSYQAEENHSITLEWTFISRPDSSLSSMFILCEFLDPPRGLVLYQVHEGVEIPDSQDKQFSGRVQIDKDVLREGRIRLHVSRLRTEDSGLYLCDVKTEDGFNSGRCRLNVTVHKNISAVPGQSVSLPCRLPNNKPVVFVKWTQPDLEPEYVLLFRDEQPDPENQHPSFRNRVELQDRRMKDGDVSLLLSNVTTSDSGKYECRVFQREATGRKRRALTSDPIWIVFLDVAPPPVHKNISAVPGQSVSLPCRLPNIKPLVVVKWTRPDLEPEDVLLFRDEQPDPENQHPSFRKRVELQDRRMKDGDVSLLLSNVTTSDSGKYECRVFQREATGRKRRTLTSDPIGIVFLDVAPPPVHKNISAVPGQNVSLPCRHHNNKPAVAVKWTRLDLEPDYVLLFRDEQSDPENQHPSFTNRVELQDRWMKDGDVSLLLSNVTTSDSGKYECRVFQREATGRKNRALTSDPIGIVFLDVAPPPVHKNISAVPGQSVSLPCRLPNNKPVVFVKWTRPDLEPEDVLLFRDEQPDPENQHPSFRNRVELQDRRMKDGDVSLLLSNVTTSDSGKYECRVFQREATGRKRRALTSDPSGSSSWM
ncbi:immunoglobulin superfamily member 3-like isoform X2 [Xiphophorus hellerii]|uniref:immunoglobulin superfamily member 3-like isoform X2 n=1 Tax=Xiphophorus hellerii TaxID=8084 RepID=UPI0013B3C469|nr:immunoglobulin superfamily member 3-like isoform X2 [Xiphophorus hellerii]